MAQFDAQINLIVNAQKAIKEAEKVAKTLEQKFSRLEKSVAKQGPLDKYIQQNDELVKQKKIQQDLINSNKAQLQQEKASLNYQLRLTAALQRQATVKQALERAGGPSNAQARARVEGAINAAAVDPKDLSLQQAVNTLLEKELQIRRELNRTEAAQAAIAGKNKVGAEYDQRVAALRRAGVEEQKLLRIEQARLDLAGLNSKKQTDLARAQNAEVERLIKAEERLVKTQRAGLEIAKQRRREAGQRFGNALASGAIGGAFPFIFGGGEITGGVLGGVAGGIAGGALGGQFGFALSLLGSAIGDAVQKSEELDRSIARLNASFDTASVSVKLTRDEIADLAKDLSLANEEAVTLLASFSAFTGPQAAELARAFGDIGGIGTAEAVARARLGEKEALEAINSLRSVIGNKEADSLLKTLEIKGAQAASAALLDALLQKQRDITTETQSTVTFWDQIQSRVASITAAISGIGDPANVPTAQDIADDRAASLPGADKDIIDTALGNLERFYRKSAELQEKYSPKRRDKAADKLERQLKAGERLARQFRQRVEILNAENALQENLVRIAQQREEAAIRIKETAAASQQAELLAANAELLRLERIKAIEEFTKKTIEGVEQYTQGIEDQVALREREEALIREGLNPQLAAAYAQIEQQADKQREILDERIKILEVAIKQLEVDGATAEELEKQRKELEKIKGLRGEVDKAEGKAKGEADKENPGKIQGYIDQLQAELKDTEGMIVSLAKSVQSAMGNAIATAVSSLVDGSQKIEQTLADMFKAIGQAFIQMAAEIIAKQLVMIALQSILKALGAASGGSNAGPGGYTIPDAAVPKTSGMSFFAEGGYVTRPTNALIGEGSEPEYVIPESKMAGALARYSSGERGSSVVNPYGGEEGAGGTAVAEAPMNVTISGGVTVMNNEEYIRKDEVPGIIKQASKAGEMRALGRLRNSPQTRRKIGL